MSQYKKAQRYFFKRKKNKPVLKIDWKRLIFILIGIGIAFLILITFIIFMF